MKFTNVNRTLIATCQEAADFLNEIENLGDVELKAAPKSAGSVNMLRTWRGWMSETAIAMNHNGCSMPIFVDSKGIPHGKRAYNKDDAHEQFTHLYLGADETGKRKSWNMSKSGDTVQASIGDRLHAMDQHVMWCAERGILLTIPRKGEYWDLKQKEVA